MKTKFFTIIIVTFLAMALAACGANATGNAAPTSARPTAASVGAPAADVPDQSMTISDQSVSAGIVTIDEVVVVRPSWVVIHPDKNGSPNKANVGRIALPSGRYENVEIALDSARVTPLLYAEIHDDLGAPGQFEVFDRPAIPQLLVTFNVTLQPADPASVLKDFFAARNAADVDAAMKFVAADAVFTTFSAVDSGPEQIRAYIQARVDNGTQFEITNVQAQATGDIVTWNFRALRNSALVREGEGEAMIQDGKIRIFTLK